MKHSDFAIGLEFFEPLGNRLRCTDVGTRTVSAIRLDHDDPIWYQGPPYIVDEVVLDEHEIERCFLSFEGETHTCLDAIEASRHPGYPQDVIAQITQTWFDDADEGYPHTGVLRFDRCRPDGEILHPYAGRRVDASWLVRIYLPFLQTFEEMPELQFISLPIATAADIRRRASSEGINL